MTSKILDLGQKYASEEKYLDANPTNPQARYTLACNYMNAKNYIAALALFNVAAEQLKTAPIPAITTDNLKQKIQKCSEAVKEQAQTIAALAKKIHFGGAISKLAKNKTSKKFQKRLDNHEMLLPIEAALIRLYTSSSGYDEIVNACLRQDKDRLKMLSEEEKFKKIIPFVKETMPILKHSLAKMPSLQSLYPHDAQKRTVFRGLVLKSKDLSQFQTGKKFVNSAFASSSINLQYALEFARSAEKNAEPVLVIAEGRTGVPIPGLSKFKEEQEVLFAPGSSFTVSNIKKVTKKDASEKEKEFFSTHIKSKHLWVVTMKE